MKTRLHRALIVIAGLIVVAAPAAAQSAAFRKFLENHPGDAIWVGLATPLALGLYRELVAWRKSQPAAPKPSSEAGLTLVELLVALVIVAIVLFLWFGR